MSPVARDRLILLALALVLWQGLAVAYGEDALPGPWPTLARLGVLAREPAFLGEIVQTLKAFGLAALIAAGLGVGLGLWFGASRLAGEVAEPILVALYALPKVTLYPTILLIFGIGLDAKVAFGALHGIAPIALFTAGGVRAIPPLFVRSARVMGLSPAATIRHVLAPAAAPEIMTGLRIGLALTLLGTLVGEMFAARSGLGYVLMQAIPRLDNATVMAVTLLLFAAAIGLHLALERVGSGALRAFARSRHTGP